MTKKPFIAHSEITNEIYIVCGAEKYLVTEQVIKAMQNTSRLEQQPSEDCVSRAKVHYMITGGKYANEDYEQFIDRLVKELENMPPVTPTHGTCKDCKHFHNASNICDLWTIAHVDNHYCADFKKRGSEE